MIFAKVDVELRDHIKARRAGSAMSTWTWGLLYARGQETDGVVHREVIGGCWVGEEQGLLDAKKLVEVGLWIVIDGGWEIANFLKKNDSKEVIDQRKEADRIRKASPPKGIRKESKRIPKPRSGGIPGSGTGTGTDSESRSEDPTQLGPVPAAPPSRPHNDSDAPAAIPTSLVSVPWSIGTPGIAALDRFELAVGRATRHGFTVDRKPWSQESICALLNTHGPKGPMAPALDWLERTVHEWVAAEGGKSAAGWEPKSLLRWLNGGRQGFGPKSQTRSDMGGASAAARRPLGHRTGTDS